MLCKFEVSKFKGFSELTTINLTKTKSYEFNSESICDGVVNKAIIYGANGVGKSNLGIAIFDLISHLTDKTTDQDLYDNYINAQHIGEHATFSYTFKFKSDTVVYTYIKSDWKILVSETLTINDSKVIHIDRNVSNIAEINLPGTESLNKDIDDSPISLISYVKNNALLELNNDTIAFNAFLKFVNEMLYFRSLNQNEYIGLEHGSKGICSDILEKGHLSDFERFLNSAGVDCKLKEIELSGKKNIAFDFGENFIPFHEVASTGTKSLGLFYFWLQRLKYDESVSFVFIDEFDAFYHHELSRLIVKELKNVKAQTILTTHNTSILNNDLLRPDCYFLMKKDGITPLSDLTEKELRLAHNLEKMYKAGIFNG